MEIEDECWQEAIHEQLEKLTLKEVESRSIVKIEEDDIEETDKDFLNQAACKILSTRTINGDIFANMIPRIWGIEGRVKIEKAGRNLFLCKFSNQRDKTRITKRGPLELWWCSPLIRRTKGGECNLNSINFKFISFWIHFHNLPRVCYCRKYTEALGNAIGVFEEVETDEDRKARGESLRVKVRIEVSTSVSIGAKAIMSWIPITYEKLPDFCYFCRRLGHVLQDCEEEEAGN